MGRLGFPTAAPNAVSVCFWATYLNAVGNTLDLRATCFIVKGCQVPHQSIIYLHAITHNCSSFVVKL